MSFIEKLILISFIFVVLSASIFIGALFLIKWVFNF